jgi:pilus assembly protein CpaC
MFKNGCSRTSGPAVKSRCSRWQAAALISAIGLSPCVDLFAQSPLSGPALGAGGGATEVVSAEQPQMFPAILAPTAATAAADATPLKTINQTRRGPNPAMDRHIESMPADYKEMEVIHHRSQLITTRQNVRRFAITDPGIIEIVQYSPTEFALIGNARGTTDLMIWFEGEDAPLMYLVTVIPDPSLEERRRIDYGKIERKLALLYPNSKVYLIPMSYKVVVRGQARDAEEAARIMQIVRGEVLTQDGALFGGYLAGGDAAGGGGGAAPVGSIGGAALAAGDVLSSYLVNELNVPGEFQIMCRVRIAELNRAMLREMGISWNSIIEIDGDQLSLGTNMNGGNILSLSGVFEDFTINTLIRALASNGTVKILEDAALVTMAGQPAAFLSGGEFAVPSTVGLAGVGVGTTTFRGFGTSIIVTPTIVDNDLIRLQITPELSQVSGQNSVNGIPGLNVKRVQTRVELREGQTIVLGGLFARQQATEQSRVPLLGEIPVVGTFFFHSKKTTEDEKELLIVVTPEIVRPVDADQQPPLPGWYVTHPDDIDFYKLNRTEGNPDLGHYQLLPFGNGQGYAQNVGFNLFNPGPSDGQMSPMANGGGGYGMGNGMMNGGYAGGAMMGGGYAGGAMMGGGYGGMSPAPVYGGGMPMGSPYATSYPQVPTQPAAPLMPQPQYGTYPAPMMNSAPMMSPGYAPEPTPVLNPTAYQGQTYNYGIQPTSGVGPQGPARFSGYGR